jgi:hypothetical protein
MNGEEVNGDRGLIGMCVASASVVAADLPVRDQPSRSCSTVKPRSEMNATIDFSLI